MSNPDDKRQRLAVLGGRATSAPGLPSGADNGVCAVSPADWRMGLRARPFTRPMSTWRGMSNASAVFGLSGARHRTSTADVGI